MEIKTPSKITKDVLKELSITIKNAVETTNTDLYINMKETTFVSFASLRYFYHLHSEMKKNGRQLFLINLTSVVIEVLEVTGFGSMLQWS